MPTLFMHWRVHCFIVRLEAKVSTKLLFVLSQTMGRRWIQCKVLVREYMMTSTVHGTPHIVGGRSRILRLLWLLLVLSGTIIALMQ